MIERHYEGDYPLLEQMYEKKIFGINKEGFAGFTIFETIEWWAELNITKQGLLLLSKEIERFANE